MADNKRSNMERQHRGMDGPVNVVIGPRCRGDASMGGRRSEGIYRGFRTTPGRRGLESID